MFFYSVKSEIENNVGAKTYRKIPNISPGLIDIRKHIFGTFIREGLIFVRAFCVSICVSRLTKFIIIATKER